MGFIHNIFAYVYMFYNTMALSFLL